MMKYNQRILTLFTLILFTASAHAADSFQITKRTRTAPDALPTLTSESWDPSSTAIIICDMWDLHHCKNAVTRVKQLAPRINAFVNAARAKGTFIIHAPSSCVNFYANHPARKVALSVPKASNLPKQIASWCYKIPAEEQAIYPLDQSDGGEDDDPAEHALWAKHLQSLGRNPRAPWKRQIDTIEIKNIDAISDSGVEIWNILEHRKIKHIMLVGVHTNMCVLGRPFGLRRLAENKKDVVLVRDLTDTMYNPKMWPYVSHFRGTDLINNYIEHSVCPTITSNQILGGQPFHFAKDTRKKIVFLIAEKEYKTNQTLPRFADHLEKTLGVRSVILEPNNNPNIIPGIADHVPTADLLFISVRRRGLPQKDLQIIRDYLNSGKPLMGIRTASHAFHTRGKHPKGHAEWIKFDPEVFGGNYNGHYGNKLITTVQYANDSAKTHPILNGVTPGFTSNGSLYKTNKLEPGTTPLLVGKVKDKPAEHLAWTNTYKKSRIFYTSLGHIDDFNNPNFIKLLTNATAWTMKIQPLKPIPPRNK